MADVVIAGAGIIGCATAVGLLSASPGLEVVLVEPDPTYARAATGRGTGGVRQLFTRPENIALSRYTLDVIEGWDRWAGEDGHEPQALNWRPNGYLFIAGRQDVGALAANFENQQCSGVKAHWLEPAQLADRHPQIQTADLAGAVLSVRDGWLDPKRFFVGVRSKAKRLGATFVTDRVVDFHLTGTAVRSAVLESGRVLVADAVVNAAGTWAPRLAAKVGMRLPVEPMRRHEHYVEGTADLDDLPFIKDVAGLAVHPHLQGLSVGLVDFDHPGGEDFTIDDDYYSRTVAPALAHRLPHCGQLTLKRTWTGLYDQNRFDGNMIIGNWPGHLDNFYVASGFSGHGFMHALGVGRGLAELILHGDYTTLDLHRMNYQRVHDNRPYPEHGIR
ncbi:FAD-binding oxidoreductase [Actinoallomurus sp. NBC_01490]|uniref:NAD(P)/FAD-dependent oxidoreductase n=1 Tax=Actinoallomurus sp. NBC_01490 TaxID=2903557 RepID=UPI002E2F1E57|nr:FAD-dependent oxidoreductase [Actinoallomurus sp. NBC_01490]